MTYTHLTSNELAMIEAYYNNHQSVAKTAVLTLSQVFRVTNVEF